MADETNLEKQQVESAGTTPATESTKSSSSTTPASEPKKADTQKKSKSKKIAISSEYFSIVKYPISTEKAIRLMESDNKLVFVVDQKANRQEIKEAVEKIFNIKIEKVNTLIDRQGNKRAIVRLAPESAALDVATNLGMM